MRKRLRYFKYNPFSKEMQAFVKKVFPTFFWLNFEIPYILIFKMIFIWLILMQPFAYSLFFRIRFINRELSSYYIIPIKDVEIVTFFTFFKKTIATVFYLCYTKVIRENVCVP